MKTRNDSGSERRWRAVFGGPPKTLFHKLLPTEEEADSGTTVWAGRPNRQAGRMRSPFFPDLRDQHGRFPISDSICVHLCLSVVSHRFLA